MTLEKKKSNTKSISTKMTELQNQKLETLAKNKGITKSSLINQLIKIGFKEIKKKDL